MSSRETLVEQLKAIDKKRSEICADIAGVIEPRRILKTDQKAINENLEAIAKGTAVVVDSLEPRKHRVLQPNEILNTDQKRINKHLPAIASGIMRVVRDA